MTRGRTKAADGREPASGARDTLHGTQSIGRAFRLLRVLASGGDSGLGLQDAARLAELSKPTAHRILSVLVAEGLVEQKGRTRRYAIGEQVQLLALSRTQQSPLVPVAMQHLENAAREIGDTVFLTRRTGLDTICVARRLGSFPIQVLVLAVGDRRPLGMSSAGIAMLAQLPEEEVVSILTENDARLRAHGTSVQASSREVSRARQLGYALRAPGLVAGTRAISVPLRINRRDSAAITVAAIGRRLQAVRAEWIAETLKRSASQIELALEQTRAHRLPIAM